MEQRKRKEEKQNRKENRFHRIKDHEEHRQSKAGLQKNGWNEADVRYWKEKGWTEQVRPWKKSRKGESHDRKNEQSVG